MKKVIVFCLLSMFSLFILQGCSDTTTPPHIDNNTQGGDTGTGGGNGESEGEGDNSFYIEVEFECNTNAMTLNCEITNKKISPNVTISSYTWNFGKGQGGDRGIDKDKIQYIYKLPGDYEVDLGVDYQLQDGTRNTKEIGTKRITVNENAF